MTEHRYEDLKALQRMKKARMDLQDEKPFFSYLMMNLTFVEKKEVPSMGVDNYGNCYYNPEWVESLSKEEVTGVLAHEVMHCALEHMERGRHRREDPNLSNISTDIVVNSLLVKDIEKNGGMKLPKGGIIPKENKMDILGYKLKKIDEKVAEEVYDELYKHLADYYNKNKDKMKQATEDEAKKGFDIHIQGDMDEQDKDGKQKEGECEGSFNDKLNKEPIDWKKQFVDACTYAKERGKIPGGMERLIDGLYETHVPWRELLYKYITSQLPVDYSYSRPNKRSYTLGVYFPQVEKETIEIMCWFDTSGSMSQEELKMGMSEVCSIVKQFKNVNLTIGVCDARITGTWELRNTTQEEILSKIKLSGGYGTSHLPVFNWIKKNKPVAKFAILFTDGYTEFPAERDVTVRTLWVVAGDYRAEKEHFPFGEVIELPKRN